MLTPAPLPAAPPVELPPVEIEQEIDDLSDDEYSELELRLYRDSHDDRAFWI